MKNLVACAVSLLAAGCVFGQGADLAPSAEARAHARDVSAMLAPLVKDGRVPGMVACAIRGFDVVMIGAAGVREAGKEAPVTAEDDFHLGSCTKAMTATLGAILVEEGILTWETTLGEVLSASFGDATRDAWKPVTLGELLTNRGAMPGSLDAGGLWGRLWKHRGTPVEARALLLEGVLANPPAHARGEYEYSNAGFSIAGHMLETRAERAYEALLEERLFAPLGITGAGFGAPGEAGVLDQPRGHVNGKGVEPGPGADNPPAITPAGRVHMPIRDWAKFAAMHLRGHAANPNRDCRLIKPESFDRLHAPAAGPGTSYAMGWLVAERPWADGVVLNHAGSNTMWYCVVWLAPKKDMGVLVACNAGGDGAARACDIAASRMIGELTKPRASENPAPRRGS